jgi:hypothetical protein
MFVTLDVNTVHENIHFYRQLIDYGTIETQLFRCR